MTEAGMETSELEGLIGESVQRIFSDHVTSPLLDRAELGEWPAGLWSATEDAGLPMALCGAETSGSGARWLDIYPVLAGLGRWSVPLPLAETMTAAWLLDGAGIAPPPDPITIAPATPALSASIAPGASQPTLTGLLSGVPWGARRGWLLTGVRGFGHPSAEESAAIHLVLVDLSVASVDVQVGRNIAGESRDEVRFKDTPALAWVANPVPMLNDPLLQLGALVRSAMLVGALERALELSISYANERVQFGKPLAKYQVIRQELAAVAGDVVAAKAATRVALCSLNAGLDAITSPFDIAVAKVRCSCAASRMAAVAHQVHGAIGFTHEHPLHHTTRRLWAWRQEFGTDAAWAGALGRAAISGSGKAFWAALCERRMGSLFITPSRG